MPVRDGEIRGWSRRAVLGGAALTGVAGALAGCTLNSAAPPEPPPPDPMEPLLAATQELAARYEQVLATHPDLAGSLAPLHRAHAAHVAALREVIGRRGPATPSPGATPTAPAPAAEVPVEPEQAVADLAEAEQQAYAEAATACLDAPPARAALLGSICAARATHREVLS